MEPDSSGTWTEFVFSDIYQRKSQEEGDEQVFYYRYRLQMEKKYNNHKFKIIYHRSLFSAEQLSEEDDYLKYSQNQESLLISDQYVYHNDQYSLLLNLTKKLGGGLGFRKNNPNNYWALSSSWNCSFSEINYDVQKNGGQIPFEWYTLANVGNFCNATQSLELKANFILPKATPGDYNNKIRGIYLAAAYQRKMTNKLNMGISTSYAAQNADLRFKNEQYGKLDHVETYLFDGCLTIFPTANICLTGGGKWLSTHCGDDSYIDIWPFSFMDVFLDSRIRLKKADILIVRPFLSLTWQKKYYLGSFEANININIEYDHIFSNQEIVIKERYYTLFPFFFDYKTSEYDFSKEIDGYVIIPVGINFSWKKLELHAEIQQGLPIKWNEIKFDYNNDANGKIKNQITGGTQFKIRLTTLFW